MCDKRKLEAPLIFKDDMVRAILAGRKTQTRRLVKAKDSPPTIPARFDADRLWVREAWQPLVWVIKFTVLEESECISKN